MKRIVTLLLIGAGLGLSGTARAEDGYGNPYRYYRSPGSSAAPRVDFGNPYRYYKAPSYYDAQRSPSEFDSNEFRRETLQYLHRHQLIPPRDPQRDALDYARSLDTYPRSYRVRRYYYSSPYFYYRTPSYSGAR